ncbi:MAG: hypothetical protein E6R03_12465 [Hyphomicrobiaceae bacterium]|nr:MAG: hypothetical protein E6R03_12465 [Hyphomicrobiaceae bacterium]
MSTTFTLPRQQVADANGAPYPGAKLYFYEADGTTPKDTYQDNDRTIAHANPVVADASGRFAPIYMATGLYAVTLKTSADVEIWTADDIDPAIGSQAGALPVASGGTGGITAGEARTNLGAAAAADVSSLTADFNELDAIVTPSIVGGTRLGNLAGQDTITRAYLGTNFGTATCQVVRATSTSYTSCATALPYDDTIPQVSEGTEVFSQSITPKEATSKIEVDVDLMVGAGSSQQTTAALFIDGAANAVQAACVLVSASNVVERIRFSYRYDNASTTAKTFSVRLGTPAGNGFLNGDGSARKFGGVSVSSLTLREVKDY